MKAPSAPARAAAPRAVVLALGNEWREDDGAGLFVAALLQGELADRLPADVALRRARGELTEVLDALAAAPFVVAVDAARSGAPPGTLHRHNLADGPLSAELAGLSSHGLGLAEALALAGKIGLPLPRVVVLAIEGAAFGTGRGLTAAVERACAEAAEKVLELVRG